MKYTIAGFSQSRLVKLGLDIADATILSWFVNFLATGKMKHIDHDGERYQWVKYTKVIEDLPILGITQPVNIGRRLRKIEKAGLMKSYIEHRGKGKGTVSWWKTTDKLSDLMFSKSSDSDQEPVPDTDVPENNDSEANVTDARERMSNKAVTDAPKVPSDSSTRDSSTKRRRPGSYDVLGLEERAPPEPDPPVVANPPPQTNDGEKGSFAQLIADMADVHAIYSDLAFRPSVDEKGGVYLVARRHGAQSINTAWVEYQRSATDHSITAFLASDAIENLPPPGEEAAGAEGQTPSSGRSVTGRCEHGHADPAQCRECFHASNDQVEHPFQDLQEKIRGTAGHEKAVTDRARSELKVV